MNRDFSTATAADLIQALGAARGEQAGPLHGLPMTVKDAFETEGLLTTSGAPELAAYVPRQDAVAIARLKAAGAIIFGKSNTPLYAGDWQTYNEVYGRTNNPWDLSRTAGGSSGGAAAAVAAGLTPLEFGSDIGGSIRNPAHYNGVYGLKPSWGVVPVRGHIPGPPGSLITPDIGVAGPIARSVADLKTVFDVVAGPLPPDAAGWRLDLDPGDDLTDVRQLRIATVFTEGSDFLPVAADVRASLEGFAARLAAAGAKVDALRLPQLARPHLADHRLRSARGRLCRAGRAGKRAGRQRRAGGGPGALGPVPQLGRGQRPTRTAARGLGRVLRQLRRGARAGHADGRLQS
jgi:amidase